MRIRLHLIISGAALLLGACATTEGGQSVSVISADTQTAVAASEAEPPGGEKVSLSASLDEYRTVTLVDDETGKPRIVCKRLKTPGTNITRKVCATKDEWDKGRRNAKGTTDAIQRNMNAKSLAQ